MVVVEDCEHAAEDGVVGMPQADVEREKRVNEVEDEDVQLCLEERPYGARFAGWSRKRGFGRGKVGCHEGFALCGREERAVLAGIASVGECFAGEDHAGGWTADGDLGLA